MADDSVFTASLSDVLSVVHITDNGMSFLEPLEITDTHVVVDVSHLSAWGLVWDIKRFFSPDPKPICGQVLMFYRPMYKGQRPKLNVFLLPANVPVQEVKALSIITYHQFIIILKSHLP